MLRLAGNFSHTKAMVRVTMAWILLSDDSIYSRYVRINFMQKSVFEVIMTERLWPYGCICGSDTRFRASEDVTVSDADSDDWGAVTPSPVAAGSTGPLASQAES